MAFAAMASAMRVFWNDVKERVEAQRRFIAGKVNELEIRVIEVKCQFDRREEDEQEPYSMRRQAYDMISESTQQATLQEGA